MRLQIGMSASSPGVVPFPIALSLVVGWAVVAVAWAGEPAAAGARQRLTPAIRAAYGQAVHSQPARVLPIGVFDSGTGGLAVLEQVLRHDRFDNTSGEARPEGDGKPDFHDEQFSFLADQANMPYGNYPAAGKQSFLVELILHDAGFLLGNEYWRSPQARTPSRDKSPVKAIVIACNTATAYGKQELERLIAQAEIDVPVINVIDAGARGAVEALSDPQRQVLGVLATGGTVASGAYPAAIEALARERGWDSVQVVQQGSIGLAGAIDGLREFVLGGLSDCQPRAEYRGPALDDPAAPLDAALLPRYGFDFSSGCMLWEGDPARPARLQINSVENYVAYETVSLLEKIRSLPDKRPLGAIVLGCTHFPYCAEVFRKELQRLYDYQEEGRYVYRDVMCAEIPLIDPAAYVAEQLYASLARDRKLRAPGDAYQKTRGEFYITVPNPDVPAAQRDALGDFLHEYKYGRVSVSDPADFRAVLLTRAHLEPATARRLEGQLPNVWSMLADFSARHDATKASPGRQPVGAPPSPGEAEPAAVIPLGDGD